MKRTATSNDEVVASCPPLLDVLVPLLREGFTFFMYADDEKDPSCRHVQAITNTSATSLFLFSFCESLHSVCWNGNSEKKKKIEIHLN